MTTTAAPPKAASFGVVLAVLGAAQFLMVLDTAVMNVSISTLVDDFNTEVTTIPRLLVLVARRVD